MTANRFRVGVDIGGTFTDIVLLDAAGRIHTKKVSSSVDDYARAIVDGLGELFGETGLGGGDLAEVLHGTTVASNAILELKGATRHTTSATRPDAPMMSAWNTIVPATNPWTLNTICRRWNFSPLPTSTSRSPGRT